MGMKKIGVIGSSGTVGTNVVEKLLKNGAYVVGGQRRKSAKFEDNPNFEYMFVDISDVSTVDSFCQKCDIVVNCISPVYLYGPVVSEVISKYKGKIYIDATDIVLSQKNISDDVTYIIAGGYVPGMSEYVASYLCRNEFESVDKVVMYQGGTESCSDAAFIDIILSVLDTDMKALGDVCVKDGKRIPFRTDLNKTVKLPGLEKEMYIKSAINPEIIEAMEGCGVRNMYWFNIYEELSIMKLSLKALTSVSKCRTKEEMAEEIRKMIREYKENNSEKLEDTYVVLGIEITGKDKKGEEKTLQSYYYIKDSSIPCGYVIAETALCALKNDIGTGIHYAYKTITDDYFDRLCNEEMEGNGYFSCRWIDKNQAINTDELKYSTKKPVGIK